MKLSEQVASLETELGYLKEKLDIQRHSIQKLSEELATRPQVDPERYARLETLLDLVSEDIEWQELHRADSPKFKPLITLYRELRQKEDSPR